MAISAGNSFKTRDTLNVGAQAFQIHRLEVLEKQGVATLAKLPFSLRVLLENLLRFEDGRTVHAEDIRFWLVDLTARKKKSGLCRRACCCRISPVCLPSSTSPPCGTR